MTNVKVTNAVPCGAASVKALLSHEQHREPDGELPARVARQAPVVA